MPSTRRSSRKPARSASARTSARAPSAKRANGSATRAAAARIGTDPPRDLEQALRDDPAAGKAYRAMPPSHRKAYVEFIEEAKRPETRVRRVQQALRMMVQWGAEHADRLARGSRASRSTARAARPVRAASGRKR